MIRLFRANRLTRHVWQRPRRLPQRLDFHVGVGVTHRLRGVADEFLDDRRGDPSILHQAGSRVAQAMEG